MPRRPLSEEHKKNIADAHRGMKYRPMSEEGKRNIRLAHIGKKLSEKAKQNMMGRIPWNKGKEHPAAQGENNYFYGKHFNGVLNPSWQGGKSFEPYATNFNQQLKDRIRVRDNFICQECGVPELECWRRLDVHHIDYDKKNCKEDNLISLCISCNAKVNKNREYWIKHFTEKITNGIQAR